MFHWCLWCSRTDVFDPSSRWWWYMRISCNFKSIWQFFLKTCAKKLEHSLSNMLCLNYIPLGITLMLKEFETIARLKNQEINAYSDAQPYGAENQEIQGQASKCMPITIAAKAVKEYFECCIAVFQGHAIWNLNSSSWEGETQSQNSAIDRRCNFQRWGPDSSNCWTWLRAFGCHSILWRGRCRFCCRRSRVGSWRWHSWLCQRTT